MSWIRLEDNYSVHRKTAKFARLMGNPLAEAYLTRLWTWASACQPDGNLAGMDDADLADSVRFLGDPAVLGDALRQSGFLDPNGMIHDWDHYQGAVVDKRNRDRARAAEERAKRKVDPPVQAESRDGRETVAGPSRDGSATVAGPSRPTVRDGTVRDETKEQVPVPPVGSTPSQVALIPEPPPVEKPKKRAAKTVKPPDDPQKRPDADAWVAAYKAGVPEADRVPLTQAFWVQWSARRKEVGIEAMLRSLKGILSLPRDKFPRNADPVVWVTHGYANGISATSTAPIASTGQRGAFPTPGVGSVREERAYSKPVEAFRVEWSAENELARIAAMGRWSKSRTVNVPWDKEWPADVPIPEGYTINRLPNPEPVVRLHDLIGAPLE